MRELQANIVKVMLAGISLVALYDILAINKGQSALNLFNVPIKGYLGLLARATPGGPPPPAGY